MIDIVSVPKIARALSMKEGEVIRMINEFGDTFQPSNFAEACHLVRRMASIVWATDRINESNGERQANLRVVRDRTV